MHATPLRTPQSFAGAPDWLGPAVAARASEGLCEAANRFVADGDYIIHEANLASGYTDVVLRPSPFPATSDPRNSVRIHSMVSSSLSFPAQVTSFSTQPASSRSTSSGTPRARSYEVGHAIRTA
jgi:hypothetical protein